MSSAADRMRASRARARGHRVQLLIEVDDRVADALHEAKLLPEWDTENREKVRLAVERMVDVMILRELGPREAE